MHQPLGALQGQATDIEIQARQYLALEGTVTGASWRNTRQPLEVLERDSDRDYYLEAKSAVAYGLVDRCWKRQRKLSVQ